MKKSLVLYIIIFLISFTGFSQNCSKYYPFDNGTTTQITTYDKKGKVSAVASNKVLNVTTNGNAEVATIEATIKDKNDELIATSNFDVSCEGNKVSIDFKSLMNPQMLDQFGAMDYEVTGTNLEIPNDISIGQELPDANMHMVIDMGGIKMKMNVDLRDRKVVGQESVTTPAGTFDCYIISYNIDIKMGMNQKGSAKQWIAEGVGMVKQEDYNARGKVTSSSLLTAFSK